MVIKTTLLLLSLALFTGCTSKYEGWTAEDWADNYYEAEAQYTNLKNCIEDYDSMDIGDKNIYSNGVTYYCD